MKLFLVGFVVGGGLVFFRAKLFALGQALLAKFKKK